MGTHSIHSGCIGIRAMRCTGGRSLRRLLPLTRLHARWQTSTVPHAATVSGSSSRLSEIVTALQYAIKYEGKEGWCNSRGRASSFAEAMADRLSKLESIIGPSPELTIAKQSAERYNELPLAERQALTRRVYTWVQALEPTPPPPQQTYQQHYNLPITQQQRQQQQHQQRYQEQQQLPYQQQHQQPYPQSYQQQPQQPYQQLYQQQQHQQQEQQRSGAAARFRQDSWPPPLPATSFHPMAGHPAAAQLAATNTALPSHLQPAVFGGFDGGPPSGHSSPAPGAQRAPPQVGHVREREQQLDQRLTSSNSPSAFPPQDPSAADLESQLMHAHMLRQEAQRQQLQEQEHTQQQYQQLQRQQQRQQQQQWVREHHLQQWHLLR
mmetsp:Transcript_18215/g.54764  ORF Transcript_18215/g.54764 Transcript_18215/m.54764 type:complete len:379 (+) Transcript_18215:287-1423(+)